MTKAFPAWSYPITLRKDDNDTYLATSVDFPELVSYGDTQQTALRNASRAIEEAIAARMARQQAVPRPSPQGRNRVAVTSQTIVKVLLYDGMRTKKINKSQLAEKLRLHRPQIDRLLNVKHSTKLETLDHAFAAVGLRLEIKAVRSDAKNPQ